MRSSRSLWLAGLVVALMLPGVVNADSKLFSRTFNPLTGGLERAINSVSDGLVRVDRPDRKKKRYVVVDLKSSKRYLIDESDNSTIVGDLNRPSNYNDKATIKKIGDGPKLLNSFPTTHYVFQAGNVVCNHLYIASVPNRDVDTYMRVFTMVPTRIAGNLVSKQEKSCQKAARDAAVQSRARGAILLVKGKGDRRVLFAIDEINSGEKFPSNTFLVKNKEGAKTLQETLRSGMSQAIGQAAYEKAMKRLETTDMPEQEKTRIRQEAKAANDKGEFMQYLEGVKRAERKKENDALLASPHITVVPASELSGHLAKQSTKPVVLLMSSVDQRCDKCFSPNRRFLKLASSKSGEVEFLFVNTDPWAKRMVQTELYERFDLASAPHALVVYRNKVLRQIPGNRLSGLKRQLDSAAIDIESGNLDRFGHSILKNSIHRITSADRFVRYLKKYLDNKGTYKAMGIALNEQDGTWRGSWKKNGLTQQSVNKRALVACKKRVVEKAAKGTCRLYKVHDRYVFEMTDAEIAKVSETIDARSDLNSPLERGFSTYRTRKNEKAYAYALGADGRWIRYWYYGKKTVESAKNSAMKKCESERAKRKIDGKCRYYAIGNEKVGPAR